MKWAALLKGVNVGGNRKLPMADLRAFLEGLGLSGVATLLASGNAVFAADETDGDTLETMLAREARAALGLDTDWLLRSHDDLTAIVAANPFADAALAHPHHLLVVFHRDTFPTGLIDAVPTIYRGSERLAAVGRELFVDYPDDIGHSRLPQAMAKLRFPKIATARNWNTVGKLLAMTA